MVNVTVIKGKDIFKYIIKLSIILIILYTLKIILDKFSKSDTNVAEVINKEQLLSYVEEILPSLNENKQEDEDRENTINPLQLIVSSQLNVMDDLEENSIIVNNDNIENMQIEQAETGLETNVLENNVPTKFTDSYKTVQVRNESNYELTEEILNPNISINSKNILIFHTHTCESYTPSDKYNYGQTGTYRTTDSNYNVVRVGTELENQLKSYNYNVLHDGTYHDYPAYDGSYGRSLETVKELLNTTTDKPEVVIDIHRDAIGDYSYAPTVQIGNDEAAQLMFVIGTDGSGLEHENWDQNLKFAIKVQEKAEELYPGLFKPIILRNSRYNQHLTKAACIIEVGATGNTMEQCLNSMKYLAKVLSEVIE